METSNGRGAIDAAHPAVGRRTFLRTAGAAAGVWTGTMLDAGAAAADTGVETSARPERRAQAAYHVRVEAARRERLLPLAPHPDNSDEVRYPDGMASFTKGLLHDGLGVVTPGSYASLLTALASGEPDDFERVITGGSARLVNPQAGLAFDLLGADSHALGMLPAPAFSSAEEAAEIVENYWMALARDVPFADYRTDPIPRLAARDLSRLSGFRGPTPGGGVTPATLFREGSPGTLTGPYVSQFLWLDTPFGAERVDRRMQTTLPGVDYMTHYAEWLAIQNGAAPSSQQLPGPQRYVCCGRDLGQWVHIDVLFQAYFNAGLILFSMGAPLSPGNPYGRSTVQEGFGTFGGPHIASVLCAVATRALKAVWFQKWFVHRRLRPEVFAGRVHNHVTSAAQYPIHPDVFDSRVLADVYDRFGSYLLPMAYPEGSPVHPAYGAGHATVAGACVTVLKAFFDESFVMPQPVEATSDGFQLVPYTGGELTVGGELNKLASNIAFGRNIAGVHWRSDATESLTLGEAVAIRCLSEERACMNEPFDGFSFTRFDGTPITV